MAVEMIVCDSRVWSALFSLNTKSEGWCAFTYEVERSLLHSTISFYSPLLQFLGVEKEGEGDVLTKKIAKTSPISTSKNRPLDN